jgi:hypothetical protein
MAVHGDLPGGAGFRHDALEGQRCCSDSLADLLQG